LGGGPWEGPERGSEENVHKLPSKRGIKLAESKRGSESGPGGPQKVLKMRILKDFVENFWSRREDFCKFMKISICSLSHPSLFERLRRFWGLRGRVEGAERFLKSSAFWEILDRTRKGPETLRRQKKGWDGYIDERVLRGF
jgi:hypothetical protein